MNERCTEAKDKRQNENVGNSKCILLIKDIKKKHVSPYDKSYPKALGIAIGFALHNYFENESKTTGNSTISQLLSSSFGEG